MPNTYNAPCTACEEIDEVRSAAGGGLESDASQNRPTILWVDGIMVCNPFVEMECRD